MILKLEILRKEKKYDKAFIIIEDILKEFDNYFNKNIEDLGRVYGTKAVIYMDMGNEEKFYELLEKSFKNKAEAKWLYDDVKDKYKDKQRFNELLVKYNQSI
jgi:tetratricopeptide (TPR) repeat protein